MRGRENFGKKLQQWLRLVKVMWPECPARVSEDGTALLVAPAIAVFPKEVMDAHF